MLDGLLGRGGFATKCKSLIKSTKNRIDVIRRKRKARQKFLKEDVADLLANGLDSNAYGRAEGLIVELMLSSCYDYVEQSCEFVLKHLSVLQKLSGCPEECREAISSLSFAAARFSDLPELRDLRQIFQDRYGNSLECYVNQEFAANLNSKSSTLEKKVRLMQDIALEFSIKWDSKALELRMSKSSAVAQGHTNFKSHLPADYNKPSHGHNATPKGVKQDVLLDKITYYPNDGHKFWNGNEAASSKGDKNDHHSKSKLPENGLKPPNSRDNINLHRDSHGNPSPGREELTSKKSDKSYWKPGSKLKPLGFSSQDKRMESFEGGSNLHDSWGNATPLRVSQDTTTARKSPSHAGFHSKNNLNEPFVVNHGSLPDAGSNFERKVQKDETPRLKPPPYYNNAIPPPYVKPNSKLKNSTHGTDLASSHVDSDDIPTYHLVHEKPDAASTSERIQLGLERKDGGHARVSKEGNEKELPNHDDATQVPALKQKSRRHTHSKSRSSHNGVNNNDAEVLRKPRSRRRDETRRGLKILFDDEQHKTDEEERIIDRLLIHYSKKPSISMPEKARRRSKSRHAHSTRESIQNGNGDGPDQSPVGISHPPRSASFPHEQSGEVQVNKVFTRAASFQPDRSKEARHVHPKLPDYDDLAARIAALRGEFKG
ncbi:hypothetical protein Lal_00046341 [Lupinus albus]|uniref:Putative vacuolar protein sorting-associated protein Ist1 n=1 Tax=Lupinus albus TaxID=3870 RepID=A0A6A5NTG3_LUPAL|nr:putative vacuolar protein sorting-associated protein Ist1 [Lupinus albus]KAF1887103.1 hypothetical protein Lal_00046341 [Lupinus albus]